MAVAGSVVPPLTDRPMKNTVVLFDVDNTLALPRQPATAEMLQLLSQLRHKVAIGFVGGSDLAKQQEQLGSQSIPVTTMFDFCFSENGLTAYRMGKPLASHSFIKWIGEEPYKKFVRFVMHYIADLDIPIKRGTFVEFRNGMVNISPIGRNATVQERNDYQKYDLQHGIREKFIQALKKEFPDLSLTYSIGGQISFDVFPTGWNKTYCLQHIENDKNLPGGVDYSTIHFFGDKTFEGGNDFEIYEDSRTVGHSVENPDDCFAQIKKTFNL